MVSKIKVGDSVGVKRNNPKNRNLESAVVISLPSPDCELSPWLVKCNKSGIHEYIDYQDSVYKI